MTNLCCLGAALCHRAFQINMLTSNIGGQLAMNFVEAWFVRGVRRADSVSEMPIS
jgi:hypothetical protein